jgi:hypothetical protein
MTSIEEVYAPIASKAKQLKEQGLDLIPHQLHLTVDNIKKMSEGKQMRIKHHHLGAHAGGAVLMLHPHHAHKIAKAFEAGKDALMKLTDHETHASFGHGLLGNLYEGAKAVGRTLSHALDNPQFNDYAQKAVEGAATAAGTALGTFVGNPVLGAAAGNALGKAGASAIKNHKAVEGAIGSLMRNPKDYAAEEIGAEIKRRVPEKYRRVAEEAVYDYMPSAVRDVERAQTGMRRSREFFPDLEEDYGDVVRRSARKGYDTGYDYSRQFRDKLDSGMSRMRDVGNDYRHNYGFPDDVNVTHGGYGAKKRRKRRESKSETNERMRQLRMRKKGKGMNKQDPYDKRGGTYAAGSGLSDDIKTGFDKAIDYLGSGVKKRRRGGDIGDDIKNGFNSFTNKVKDAFQPVVDTGNQIVSGATQAYNQVINTAKGVITSIDQIAEDPATQAQATTLAKQLASALIHQGIPAAAGALGGALADALAAGTLQPELIPVASLIGSEGGAAAGTYLANLIGDKTGYGMKRGRGRPRKTGKGVENSKPFKLALARNYGGLQLHDTHIDNAPVSAFRTNPSVTPAPHEMTMSPYQRINSPAMNPFIPQYYTQEGGTQCGYAGRGITRGAHRAGAGLYTGSEHCQGHGLF